MSLAALNIFPPATIAAISLDDPRDRCLSFQPAKLIANATRTRLEYVPSGTTVQLPDNDASCNRPSQVVEANLCRVALHIPTSHRSGITFELWLPDEWPAARLVSTGNGGVDGCIKYEDLAYTTGHGFAAMGTNNGHNGTTGAPFFHNPDILEDFAHRALHTGTVAAKTLTEAFYRKAPARSYYIGCSLGGRMGIKGAEAYPQDYDGIVAGCPAVDFNHLQGQRAMFYPITGAVGSHDFIAPELWKGLIHNEVLKQCDGIDGVLDGIIEVPSQCQFKPETLLCSADQSTGDSECLTESQVEQLRKIYAPYTYPDGSLIFPRMNPGNEIMAVQKLLAGRPFSYSEDWFRYVVLNDPNWDASTYDSSLARRADDLNPFDIRTYPQALPAFKARGGRMIAYHGGQDNQITSFNTERFWDHMAGADQRLHDWFRFFRISGMFHCNGGPGAWAFGQGGGAPAKGIGFEPETNVLAAIVAWVEEDRAPWTVTGTKFRNDTVGLGVELQRRHCFSSEGLVISSICCSSSETNVKMRWQILASALAVGSVVDGAPDRYRRSAPATQPLAHRGVPFDKWTRDGPVAKQFANSNTTKYAINGTGIPDVDFDIGEAYAGQMSISEDLNGPDKFYFWFQPSPNPAAKKEIVIWLNGGPGCSSLEGFLQENGPFLWQYGTYKPVPNPWGWHHLTNMLWVEQPINTGFSTGNVTAKNEEDVAKQFMGFFKNFIKTFSMQGYKVYITGESYAGMYCPYIASAMLDAKDTTHFNMKGMIIYDPSIGPDRLSDINAVAFADYHHNLFPFNESFTRHIHDVDRKCGYADLRSKYLTYPPKGPLPNPLPGIDPKSGKPKPGCETGTMMNTIQAAVTDLNPCFDVYQVATTCPLLWDVLGFPGSFDYLPKGASIYFDRPDVKKAINAPVDRKWAECGGPVFVDPGDQSPPSSNTVLGGVIDRTKNVIIGHGALDFILLANGTLMSIQNMTWGGRMGFQRKPVEPFYVPYHTRGEDATIAASGVFGTTHTERGLTYVGVALTGHMVPQYAPSAAFRHVEVMLGRVKSLSSRDPFTTDSKFPQPDGPLGKGTAPPGYSD
ncbi:40S ribosomal protein S19 [Purpureocillium lavendulum]|uniref:Carboxylic ester hydrolase n=1 Tax=Purpureocillium lavendulum TaxID=1247861 RepID=A0AB34FQE1_9HYPO|nr:40S ribosomal protein S19 [Purpureocillium lavendulum]